MHIRMRTTAAGPAGVYLANKEIDVPDSVGRRFIVGGYAEAIEREELPPKSPPKSSRKSPPKETATASPAPETTQMDAPPRRRRKTANA